MVRRDKRYIIIGPFRVGYGKCLSVRLLGRRKIGGKTKVRSKKERGALG